MPKVKLLFCSDEVQSLIELSAQTVALQLPFEQVEKFYPPIPENLQLRIAFWSFPESEEDIRCVNDIKYGKFIEMLERQFNN